MATIPGKPLPRTADFQLYFLFLSCYVSFSPSSSQSQRIGVTLKTMAPGNPASGIVLHLDDSASSKTVLLVANIVRWVSDVAAEVQIDSKVNGAPHFCSQLDATQKMDVP
jgi:hypothetical protein